MASVETADRLRLVKVISSLPDFASESARRRLVELAGLDSMGRMIDVSGSPFIAAATLVDYLADYGRTSDGPEALGQFLNLLLTIVGIEQQAELRQVIDRYSLMTPLAPQPAIDSWQGSDTSTDVQEKIIRFNTLRPVSFMAEGARIARSVAYLEVAGGGDQWSGTGFLVAPDLLLTNAHVIPDRAHAAAADVVFNYENDAFGRSRRTARFKATDGGIFAANTKLDYSLVQVDGRPGDTWGWLPLADRQVATGARVNIIQHPGGQPKQVALQSNFVEAVGADLLQYITSTLPGSSGAPVLNDQWQVVGIHHAGGNLPDPSSGLIFFRNEGIRIGSILADLDSTLRSRLTDQAQIAHSEES